MQLEAKKLLEDVRMAAEYIINHTKDMSLDDYISDKIVPVAIERKFEIIGEALNRLKAVDQQTLQKINNYRQIIAFRNILIHGYDAVDNEIVWRAIQEDIPVLLKQALQLMNE